MDVLNHFTFQPAEGLDEARDQTTIPGTKCVIRNTLDRRHPETYTRAEPYTLKRPEHT